MLKTTVLSAAAVFALVGTASAQVDGTYKGAYGSPLVYQSIGTHFGNSNAGLINTANGSELDAAFFSVSGGNLNLLFTGNLESNFNKLVVLFDNGNAGGYNVLPNAVAGLPTQYAGMTLDQNGVNGATGTFRATQWLSTTCGGATFGMFVDGGDFLANNGGYQGGNDGQSGGVLSGGSNSLNALVALNNSNVLGVDGNAGTAQGFNALTATTGLEMQIPLASLGLGSVNGLKVMAFINGSNHDYLSNQFLSPLPVGGLNLGGDGAGNFTGTVGAIDMNGSYAPGNQFFVVPAPGALGLLGLGGLLAARRRRA